MKPQVVLSLVVIVTMVIILWDLWLVSDGVGGNTVSEVIRKVSEKNPMIPFGIGLVVAHWFW